MTGMFVIAMHRGIVRAEEKHLRNGLGREYSKYFNCVRQNFWSKKLQGFSTG